MRLCPRVVRFAIVRVHATQMISATFNASIRSDSGEMSARAKRGYKILRSLKLNACGASRCKTPHALIGRNFLAVHFAPCRTRLTFRIAELGVRRILTRANIDTIVHIRATR